MSVWRIGYCPSPQPDEAVLLQSQGLGSTFFDGRWHNKTGRQVVYTGSTRALCQLEKRVHTSGIAVRNQVLVRLDLPDDAILLDVFELGLADNWTSDIALTRGMGDAWLLAGASLGLWVPSIVEPLERNLLLNPAHSQYARIRLAVERNPFEFDLGLF